MEKIFVFFNILFFDYKITADVILNSLFFVLPYDGLLPVVSGSFWFMYMYIKVSILSSIIICVYNKYCKSKVDFKYVLFVLFLIYGIKLVRSDFIFLDIQSLMYTFVFLFGYYLYNTEKMSFKMYSLINVIVVCCLILFTRCNGYNFFNMQYAKGMCFITYLLYSMILILFLKFVKDRVDFKNKILIFIGKNSLLFYFTQGIGGSLIFYFLPYIVGYSKIIVFIIMLLSNIFISIVLGVLLYYFIIFVNYLYVKITKSSGKLV